MGTRPQIYQVLEWDAHFENFKSRSVQHCSFVCVPNQQHGAGVTYILSQPDGIEIYGVWNLIIGACSQHAAPRDGWLTNDGKPTGTPWDAAHLARRWRTTEEKVQRAMDVFTCEHVGWMKA